MEGEQPQNLSFNKIASGVFGLSWVSNDAWDQSAVTWNNLAAGETQSLGQFTWPSGQALDGSGHYFATWDLSLTAGLLADLTAGQRVSILGTPQDSQVSFQIDQNRPPHNPAQLLVTATAVPLPAVVWLLGSALAGLGLFRKQTASSRA